VIITSNIMAILGLRSLYFMLAGAMAHFDYLKYALAALLVFIGAKMIGHGHVHIPNVVSLAVIAGMIGAGVIASIISNRRRDALVVDPIDGPPADSPAAGADPPA
jgi:tellurite resistance protein TerC